jgi:hypothetical protein
MRSLNRVPEERLEEVVGGLWEDPLFPTTQGLTPDDFGKNDDWSGFDFRSSMDLEPGGGIDD